MEAWQESVIKAIEAITQLEDLPEEFWYTSDPWQLDVNFRYYHQDIYSYCRQIHVSIWDIFTDKSTHRQFLEFKVPNKHKESLQPVLDVISKTTDLLELLRLLIGDSPLNLQDLVHVAKALNRSLPRKEKFPISLRNMENSYCELIRVIKRVTPIEDHDSPELWKHPRVLFYWHKIILDIEQARLKSEMKPKKPQTFLPAIEWAYGLVG